MKIVNPIGREPNQQVDMKAYGCVCSTTVGNYASISQGKPCNVCAFSCDPGNYTNQVANSNLSQSRGTTS